MSGAQRAMADVLLRGVGGRSVLLRMPSPAIAGNPAEQLGLATPQFQDLPLTPVVLRRVLPAAGAAAIAYELLVSATAVERATGSAAYGSASVLFRDALGVLVDDALLEIDSAAGVEAFGEIYLYRLKLHGAQVSLA